MVKNTQIKHHVIYVPGILDNVGGLQGLLVWKWRAFGVRGHLHEMPWKGEGEFQAKLEILLAEIDKYADAGHKVSLVGASAGASAVINAYVARKDKIQSIALICAKINHPNDVGEQLYARNPAFKTSMYQLQDSLKLLTAEDKAKMTSYYSPTDQTVPYSATETPGIREVELKPMRHGQAILYCLSFGARRLIKAL